MVREGPQRGTPRVSLQEWAPPLYAFSVGSLLSDGGTREEEQVRDQWRPPTAHARGTTPSTGQGQQGVGKANRIQDLGACSRLLTVSAVAET